MNGNDGLLVYLVDMNIGSLKGPISIQPSEQDVILNPQDDVERYSRAPLSSGQYVKVKDVVVLAEEVTKKGATFKVLPASDFRAIQEVRAKEKVALEQKPILESEATAAAIKKTTITCIKGKLNKKVTAIKPKCPAGYKKK